MRALRRRIAARSRRTEAVGEEPRCRPAALGEEGARRAAADLETATMDSPLEAAAERQLKTLKFTWGYAAAAAEKEADGESATYVGHHSSTCATSPRAPT